MRIAVLVKQIPEFEDMTLGPDGRLQREGVALEMNAYCRRAVSLGVELARERPGSEVVVYTLGPPAAEDALREAIAWGLARDVEIRGVHVSDPAFAGSDTLATARALAAALARDGAFDLVLSGRNSLDADTGQVPPELAELLDLPFLAGVRRLDVLDEHGVVHARCEHDDGQLTAEVALPAVLSCAERLIEPTKVDPEGRAAVPAERLRRVTASELGPGPWGDAASPTRVGATRVLAMPRARERVAAGPAAQQARDAVLSLAARGALAEMTHATGTVATTESGGPIVAVVVEPNREHMTREVLGEAARLAEILGGNTVALVAHDHDAPAVATLGAWGADVVVAIDRAEVEEDVAAAVATWAATAAPHTVLAPSTVWGREVAARAAARLGAGLTGDAVELEIVDGRLVAWKPAFGGQLVAAVTATTAIQMATVRAGVLPTRQPRTPSARVERVTVEPRRRVHVIARSRDDDLDALADAAVIIGVGRGVAPDEYDALEPLQRLLGAELGASRKVTDEGWLPRSRQIGITGRSIAPRLFVSIGASGKFNHSVGWRAAHTVLAVNPDPDAPVFDAADVGIVGDWHELVPALVAELSRVLPLAAPDAST
ncbi:MAG TPA: FAD-binding protein [Acidimicrobiia bacterium]|nr:FAD-binding protein [Acidimicrobiia bacterium]